MIGGWYDHAIDQKLNFFNALMQQSPVSSQHKLLMGPWVHGGHGISQVGSSQQGELFFYNASNWNDSLSLRFFDFYLKNVNNGWNNEPVMQYYQIGDNQWQQATSLSAINVDTLQMFLNSDNYLTTIPPDGKIKMNILFTIQQIHHLHMVVLHYDKIYCKALMINHK